MVNKKGKKDGFDKLFDEIIGDDPKRLRSYNTARFNIDIAEQIYNLRKKSGLTQKQLANLIGTKDTVISRLENADYDGHTIKMLLRIADALNNRLEIKFVRNRRKNANSEPAKQTKLTKQIA